MSETILTATDQTSPTATMDWYAPALAACMGLWALRHVAHLLVCDLDELPKDILHAPHLPITKCPGVILNKCTRPIIVESGVLRHRQHFQFRRGQLLLTPDVFLKTQFAIIRGLSPSHIRRLIYVLQIQRVRIGQSLCMLKLDQSNAYGQTDLQALRRQADQDPVWSWAIHQSAELYQRLLAFVVTVQGLTTAYAIASGVIQRGGLDPFWYVLYTAMLATAIKQQCPPVTVDTISGPVDMTILCVVDDTIVLAPTMSAIQSSASQCVAEIQRLNGKCNPDKFDLVHQAPSRRGAIRADGVVHIDGQVINSATGRQYVKMVGGNIHLAATVTEDEKEIRSHGRRVMSRLAQHPVALRMLRGILDGMLAMRWSFRKQVDWPRDLVREQQLKGPASAATSTAARCCRMALQLPRRTPREFVYGSPSQGRLGVPCPAEKAWRMAVTEIWIVAHSPHDTAREACLRELQRAFSRTDSEHVAPGKTSDFSVFAQWCRSRDRHFRLYNGKGST